ncbi:MAG: type II secretion system F family protein [Candidatus Omnitrophota bacterium]
MASFKYKARGSGGKLVEGVIDSQSKEDVSKKLHSMGCVPTNIELLELPKGDLSFMDNLQNIKKENMLMFYIHLASMMDAGLSLISSLISLSSQIEHKKLKGVITAVAKDVSSGASFSESIARYPKIFSPLFVNMVRSGEVSGKLPVILTHYAKLFEGEMMLKEKIKSAMFYPFILLAMGMTIVLFLVTFIIPKFADIFMQLGMDLPIITQVLYKAGTSIKQSWYIIFIIVVGLVFLYKKLMATKKGRYSFDKLKLRLPVLGPLYLKIAVSRFSRILGTLLNSGVPILNSFDATMAVLDNAVLTDTISKTRFAVEKGGGIANSLSENKEFPQDAIQMIRVGEESGTLGKMLNKIADFYDMVIDFSTKRLTTLIEPFFLVVMGVVVGFVMASMLIPIFSMVNGLRT